MEETRGVAVSACALSAVDAVLLYAQGALIAWIAHMYGRVHGAFSPNAEVRDEGAQQDARLTGGSGGFG